MYLQENSKKPRNTAFLLDMMHIVLGGVIVLLAVFSFLNPEGNMFLFPIIFFLAAVLNIVNGVYRFRLGGHEKKKKWSGLAVLGLGLLLLLITAVSAVSIWWG